MPVSHKAVIKATKLLSVEIGRNGGKPITVEFEGQPIEVSLRYIDMLLNRELAQCTRVGKSSRRSKSVSPENLESILSSLETKTLHSLTNSRDIKISPSLQRLIMGQVSRDLKNRKVSPKASTFSPRLLFRMDDHFVDFLKGIKLGLLAPNMESVGTASLRTELSDLESSFIKFFSDTHVGASTVLNALVSLYTTHHGLRVKEGPNKSHIKIDSRIRRLLDAPMNSLYNGKDLSSNYKAGTSDLSKFRYSNPGKSVMDFLLASSDKETVKNGYLVSKNIMVLVSAHLIPATSFGTDTPSDLSMTMDSDGNYVNQNVNTLVALQAMMSATSYDSSPADMPARSPSRSVSRSRATKTPSRSVSRARSRR